jgi:hypothetical protein
LNTNVASGATSFAKVLATNATDPSLPTCFIRI